MDNGSIALISSALGLALGAWLALALRSWRERRGAQTRNERAKRGEHKAGLLLQAAGYRIQGRQLRCAYQIQVDHVPQHIELILDYLVEAGGEQLVAEVKTGAAPISIQNPNTRRQLLEYQLATASRRVLLVDPETDTITEVTFPISTTALQTATPARGTSIWPAVVAIALVVVVVWWHYLVRH